MRMLFVAALLILFLVSCNPNIHQEITNEQNTIEKCLALSNNIERTDCVLKVTDYDENTCTMEGVDSTACYLSMAIEFCDESFCYNIDDFDIRLKCNAAAKPELCYYLHAADTDNISWCDKIDEPMSRIECKESISKEEHKTKTALIITYLIFYAVYVLILFLISKDGQMNRSGILHALLAAAIVLALMFAYYEFHLRIHFLGPLSEIIATFLVSTLVIHFYYRCDIKKSLKAGFLFTAAWYAMMITILMILLLILIGVILIRLFLYRGVGGE